jgi:uncharacterized OsmC-like protein
MIDVGAIKRTQDRNVKAVALRPSVGIGTSITKSRIVRGFTCEVTEGSWRFVVDLPESEGGENLGPTPGVFGRAALASCLSMGIVLLAARRDIPLNAVSVEVRADWDLRGTYGLAQEIPPGYTQIRVLILLESSASAPVIEDLLTEAERLSPYLDVFRRPFRSAATFNAAG